ncbi:hypothetical protein C499_04793 [Halogeometricum borinquense DSM 11551]|uniref:Uncharacterized protein n=1 Tax=Halogeometricum borinquense (strain ATCC 700274 / DSM 11551 / JCM 10706 / KCTC 4070 / PR3) TaxID=469382 RepID=E4NTJ6_HALBP|nr:hypothetical protein [Halogeometricum borinquense]ADQ67048.1 hypothetical protein Hbor_14730 [Halogeometricum borinquense DSM 11551]ELY29595.1 hypothetical protein C499_04793 [Halogeometricum borinquense DSM 11551]
MPLSIDRASSGPDGGVRLDYDIELASTADITPRTLPPLAR